MKLEALDKDGNVEDEWTVFSIGGGSLAEEGKEDILLQVFTHTTT